MCKEKLPMRLPNTGQKKSYMTFDDGYYYQKSPFYKKKRFIDNKDGTITDRTTTLRWIKNPLTIGLTTYNWYEAILTCKKLKFNGIKSWRLPNINELMFLVDYSKESPPLNGIFECTTDGYWTSTTYVGSPSTGWVVYFDAGGVYFASKKFKYSIRPVCNSI